MPREYSTDMEWQESIVVPVRLFVVMPLLVEFTFVEIATFSTSSIIGEDKNEKVTMSHGPCDLNITKWLLLNPQKVTETRA